jgi:hypothetical protein
MSEASVRGMVHTIQGLPKGKSTLLRLLLPLNEQV